MPKILIIEDNEPFRKVIAEYLQRNGYDILEAADGSQAASLMKKEKPDLVITDIIMPNKDGAEIIDDLKKEHPEIEIIAMSGGGQDPAKQDLGAVASHYGIKYTFEKPFSMQDLLAAVKELTE